MNSYQRSLEERVVRGKNVFVADTARVLGAVELADDVSVWFGSVIRADFDSIFIDERTNVQEGVYMHVDNGCPVHVGKDNVIGHGAILHGCTTGDNVLIGMRATVMNNAKIGKGCIIGAHALVKEGMEVPDFSMVLGTPGKIVKTLPESIIALTKVGVQHYLDEARKYLESEGIYL